MIMMVMTVMMMVMVMMMMTKKVHSTSTAKVVTLVYQLEDLCC